MAELIVASKTGEKQNSFQTVNGVGIAAIGGGGIGTLIVGFAQLIPESNAWRTVLVIIAPAISVGISTLWVRGVEEYTHYRQKKNAQEIIIRMRKYLQECIKDPNISEEMKAKYRQKLEVLEDEVFNRELNEIKQPN